MKIPMGSQGGSAAPANLLDQSLSLSKPGLSTTQHQVDALVGGFIHQATDWKSLAAMTSGGLAYRTGRIGILASGIGKSGIIATSLLRGASLLGGLATEVTAFEMTNRSLSQLTGEGTQNPHLWKWNGTAGLQQGWVSSFVTFGTLKGFGKLSEGRNLILQHGAQDMGMVLGHQLLFKVGLGEKPEGTLAEQLLHAEVTNLQIGAGMTLGHSLAGGKALALEKGMDLSLQGAPLLPSWDMPPLLAYSEMASAESGGGFKDPPHGQGGPPRKLYKAPQIKEVLEIDHQGQPVSLLRGGNKVTIDPLLDVDLVRKTFEYLETVTSRGSSLKIQSLNFGVYSDPRIRFNNLTELYRLVGDSQVSFYLLENLLYVIHRVEGHEEKLLKEAIDAGYLTEVDPVSISSQTLPRRNPMEISIPWKDPGVEGLLNLHTVLPSVYARWIDEKNLPDLSPFDEMPTLKSWLEKNRRWVHGSDLARVQRDMESLWRIMVHGEMTLGQAEAARRQIQGLLGEIGHRSEVVEAFRAARESEKDLILLVEGEIRTPDQRMASDALIGRLDPENRHFEIHQAFEITTAETYEEQSLGQHQRTLEERYLEKGLVILAQSGEWGRVAVATAETIRTTIVSPTEIGKMLQGESERILQEIIAFLTLKRAGSRIIPMEERRLYHGVKGYTAAGRLLNWVIKNLWQELDHRKAMQGQFDLGWLALQLQTRVLYFPPSGKAILIAYLASLKNVSQELNLQATRKTGNTLVRQVGVSSPTIIRYQREIEGELVKRNLPILPDPEDVPGKMTIASHKLIELVKEAWKKDELQEIMDALKKAVQAEIDVQLKKLTGAYLSILQNVSKDLNPTGKRMTATDLAREAGVSPPMILNHQRAIEKNLEKKGLAFLPDPGEQRGKGVAAGHQLSKMIKSAWEKSDLSEIVQNLEEALAQAEIDPEVKKVTQAYLSSLKNVSKDLNPIGVRKSVAELSKETSCSSETISKYHREIEEKLKKRGLAILPDPGERTGKRNLAGQQLSGIKESAWEKKDLHDVVKALHQAAQQTNDPELKKYIQAYLRCLENVSADLNPTRERKSISSLENETGATHPTVSRYQREIIEKLISRGLPVLPDPEEGFGKGVSAGHQMHKITRSAWEQKDLPEVAKFLKKAEEDETNPEVKKFIVAYLACLENLSQELTPSGIRKSESRLANELQFPQTTVSKYEREIEKQLGERALAVRPSPFKRRS